MHDEFDYNESRRLPPPEQILVENPAFSLVQSQLSEEASFARLDRQP
jgi:hypothetical protein